ncbi:SEC-C domain-containing protein [Bacillus sp. ISL-75]|uniref:SEC-C metal-binding domain-containing protein n=1 Tax=Bacillus sp. ISL-75 TaxID=2819137 RepID=UPI001BEB4792|nr:SEC-C metal-binding domain-containing protein [Bacillus sp. ISL-75]MBT2729639.1 SEC-C domain-containing protein [Bacillus sp. ISL-75]
MEKINRNGPCPCGSGKKYKKCCGANEAVSITDMIDSEIDVLQKHILHYAYYHFGPEIQEDFEVLEEMIEIDNEQEREFYELIHAIWFTLFEGLDDGETIIEKFIAAEIGKIKRPKLRKILQTWAEARTIAGKILAVENNRVTVEDGFTSEEFEAIIANVPITFEEGSFFVGILVPYDQNYVFFPSPFDLPDLKPEDAFSYIEVSSIEADYDSPQEYLTDFFLEVLTELPVVGNFLEIDEMDWPAPIYKEVADIFKQKLESLDVPTSIVDTGVILWLSFCQKRQKRIQNPNLYVAALHYLLSTIAPLEKAYTQKELAKLYSVSTGSVSSIFTELETVLHPEIAELIGMVYGLDEAPLLSPFEKAPVIDFPRKSAPAAEESRKTEAMRDSSVQTLTLVDTSSKKTKSPVRKVSKRDEERARNLIYDAYQSDGQQRYKLAEEAVKLNPNCSDAYVILAEKTKSLEEAILLYEKGIQAGERELGKAFFKENKGHFWGLIETRPFMRAKLHYAEALSLIGKINEAILQYEELLELNPMDNQGVRYSLFVAYLDAGDTKKASDLLYQYEEESAQDSYNKLLLEIHERGFTAKAAKLLKEAKKENKYVINYLIGKKRLPAYPPDYYGFGDENEAIVYCDMHLHLWTRIDGLVEWLKGK